MAVGTIELRADFGAKQLTAWRRCCSGGYFSGENAVSLILSTTRKVMTAAAIR
jgi:hypothetical protein